MAVHFSLDEMADRMRRLQTVMAERQIDGMLLFAQESMFWLTGYDTFGFCFFQCLHVGQDGRTALLTRSADLRQAQHTSLIDTIRVWVDAAEANPAHDLRAMLADLGVAGHRLGVEYDSYGLTYANGQRVASALEGFVTLVDASSIVPRLRVTKSDAELAFVREAARLSDAADRAAIDATRAGADEGDILAAQQSAIFAGGGDYPGNEFIIGSGRDALLCRYKSGRRRLDANDQITLEFAGVFRHYHAAIMRTHVIGRARAQHVAYHAAAREALAACETELRPGRTAGDVYAAHARVFDQHGLSHHRLNACGYSLGAKFTPSWMDPPMFFANNYWVLAPNQVVFLHMILMDSETDTAMCLGRTSIVTLTGPQVINAANLDLVTK
ncbi:Xaa-Pro peptidase family protein [Lichenihabitans sp. PAMC28606]|uniref:M24 family metallopeptidase n=1 Tax=Lichenihabitans sp. PAMC28606 TaxID=2880932 RepID=UPI001D0B303A|nr:Xaa-Pro peptidase family protein [Lichenihabitans sp. PAMC28606]UDL95918.1 Xaa-Pro peptidase family protein [Lichenihabitans sp. PAMC28606]